MLRTLEGIYRDGKIDIARVPDDVLNETRVLVTFLERNLAVDVPENAYKIDNEMWESRFRETPEAEWDKLADLTRQEIASGDVTSLEEFLSED